MDSPAAMSSPRSQQKPRHPWRALGWSALIALAIYLASAAFGDVRSVAAAMAGLGAGNWALVLGLSLVNYGLRYLRWSRFLAVLGHRPPWLRHLGSYIAGFALTTTPGKAGEAVRSVYLARHGVPATDSLAAFFAERCLDLAAVALLTLGVIGMFPGSRWLLAAVAVGLTGVTALVCLKDKRRALLAHLQASGQARWRRAAGLFVRGLDAASRLLSGRTGVTGLGLGVVAWAAEGVALAVILQALGVPVALPLAAGIYAVSLLAGAASFIPGGLGSTEAVMVMLLTLIGVDTATAVAATLICRLATLWFAVALGVLAMLALQCIPSRADAFSAPGEAMSK